MNPRPVHFMKVRTAGAYKSLNMMFDGGSAVLPVIVGLLDCMSEMRSFHASASSEHSRSI